MTAPVVDSAAYAPGRPLRVTHVVGGTMAGSTRVVLNLARLHDRARFDPSIIYASVVTPDARVLAETERLGVPFREVTKRSRYDLTVIPRIARAMRQLGTEIAVLHGFGGYSFGGGGAFLARVPVRVRVEHSPELYGRGYRVAARLAEPITDSTILVSRFLVEYLREQGLSPRVPEVIYNGVELDPLLAVARPAFAGRSDGREVHGAGDPPVVLMAARLDPPKDQAALVEAVALLRDRGRRVRLRIAGIGGEEARLRAQAAALGVSDRVELLGFRSDLPSLLEGADVAALISRYEGFGLAAVEGMAAARPVLLSRTTSLPELIDDGVEGLLVPPEPRPVMVQAIADALERLCSDPAAARAMGEAGRARARRDFDLLSSVRAVERHLLRTAAARRLS